ncbi:hypothetical protein DFH09DRAFT_951544 [Mycena vulgaris]|nr:hypothetical protein DFH09DRAFT_951544 [Mycena vulgaris]
MKDEDLDTIYSTVILSGIVNWNPDVLGSPDSMYNIAHEHVAIKTFQVVCSAHGYSRLGLNLTNLMDCVLLSGFYHTFVFSYILKMCNSDDEAIYAPISNQVITYHRKKKIARSTKAETWIRDTVNVGRMKRFLAAGLGAQVKEERLRMADPDDTAGSDISQCLPEPGVPLDWFDPEYFNAMPATVRQQYAEKGVIALPLVEHLGQKDWKNMTGPIFMKKYGNDVLKLYNLPTAEEITQMAMNNLDSDDEGPPGGNASTPGGDQSTPGGDEDEPMQEGE